MKTILCYGDSNTYGFVPQKGGRYPREIRWTGVLKNLLGGEYEIIEEGLNGRTTAFPRPGADWKNGLDTIKPIMVSHKPIDILVVMLGTNDCGMDVNASLDEMDNGIRSVVNAATEVSKEYQGFAPAVLVVSPAPIGHEYKSSPFADKLSDESIFKSEQIATIQRKFAEEEGFLFMDAGEFAAVSDLDSEHLTPEGHAAIGKEIAKIIIKHELGDSAKDYVDLGNAYYYGNDHPVNLELAAFCYKQAADLNDPEGQCLYGYCLREGIGADQDVQKAFELFNASADQGFAMAEYNVGHCYAKGLGTVQDQNIADEWFKKAKENGYEE